MASQRITLLNNKSDNAVKKRKKDIAKLLEIGKEEKARIMVEHVIRDDNTMEARELTELLCETCVARLDLITAEKQCPFDMVQTVSTLIYVARRLGVPELKEVRKQFVKKYGKEFAQRAERNVDSCVNSKIVQKLSVHPPTAWIVVAYLKEIAKQYGVAWTPQDPLKEDEMDAAMAPPTGFSVKPSPAAGFEHLYNPNAKDEAATKSPGAPPSGTTTGPVAPPRTSGGMAGMTPTQFDQLDKNGDGVLTRDEFNGDLKIPCGASADLPVAAVIGEDDANDLPLPPPAPKGDLSNSSSAAASAAAPSAPGNDDVPDFDDLQARFNALNRDD